jgi:geranylgeranyl reductase family protein
MPDVVIVGGGPAGSTLAWALRASGLKVAIIDKASFPRDKVCAGWVTPAVMQELQIDLADYAGKRVLQPITGFSIGQVGQRQVKSDYAGQTVSYGIRRYEFDHYLLQRSEAELMTGIAVESIQRSANGWRINDDIETRLIVGAGGHFCPVARLGGMKAATECVVAAQEVEFEMTERQAASCRISGGMPELFFSRDLKGYGWIFRKGNYLNIGLGREDRHKLSTHVENFVAYLKRKQRLAFEIPQKFNGHAYLLYPHAQRRLVDDGLLLIGDAAGLAYPQSGEGIRPAVESALLAATAINKCNRDYSSEALQLYRRMVERRFGLRLDAEEPLQQNSSTLKTQLASQLLKTHWFTKRIVSDRWFLHSQQQPLQPSIIVG